MAADMLVHVFMLQAVHRNRAERGRLGGIARRDIYVGDTFVITFPDGTELYREPADRGIEMLVNQFYDREMHDITRRNRRVHMSFTPPYDDAYALTQTGNYLEELRAVPLTAELRKRFRKAFRKRKDHAGPRYINASIA